VNAWTLWDVSQPLTITPTDSLNLNSVWLPHLPSGFFIVFSPVPSPPAQPQYVPIPSSGAEVIPLPPGTTSVTLWANATGTYYVYAAAAVFRPFKETAA
jgi:hypothetical protein